MRRESGLAGSIHPLVAAAVTAALAAVVAVPVLLDALMARFAMPPRLGAGRLVLSVETCRDAAGRRGFYLLERS